MQLYEAWHNGSLEAERLIIDGWRIGTNLAALGWEKVPRQARRTAIVLLDAGRHLARR